MAEYIDREALEAAFREVTRKEIEFYGYYNLLCFPDEAACEIAREIPAADVVEVKRGRWENVTGGMVTLGDCSECKKRQPVCGTNFCNNCGADMREEKK